MKEALAITVRDQHQKANGGNLAINSDVLFTMEREAAFFSCV